MTKPKILFVSHDASRTGAPISLLAFMRWLRANSKYELGALLQSSGALEDSFRELGHSMTLKKSFLFRSSIGRRLRRFLPNDLQRETGKIRQMFSRDAYNLIYSNTIMNGYILEALAPFRVPVITHVHEMDYWIWRGGKENFRRVLAHTTAFIAASKAVRDNLIRNHGVPEEKITVVYEHIRELSSIPSAAEKASAKRKLGLPDDAFIIGGCGAEYWRKGRDLVPQLLSALRRQQPDKNFHFVWIGRAGTEEEEYTLRHDLRSAGVETFFHSRGEVENPMQLFHALDVFALLSREDPFPLACLEAAVLEKPIVCFSNAGGMPEFVQNECGFVSPYLDLETMARNIIYLSNNPGWALACGQRARAKIISGNTIEATAIQLLAIIEKMLEAKPVKAPLQLQSDTSSKFENVPSANASILKTNG